MNTILIILAILAIAGGAVYFFTKSGKIKDTDGDLIPDVVEETAEKVQSQVKQTKAKVETVVEKVKEDIADVKEVIQKLEAVVEETPAPAKKKRRYYKPKTNKQ